MRVLVIDDYRAAARRRARARGEVRRRAPGLPATVLKYPAIDKDAPIPISNAITLVNPIALDDLETALHALAPRTLHSD